MRFLAGAGLPSAACLGPSAEALAAGGLDAYIAAGETVADVIEAFKKGELEKAVGATVPPHSGLSGNE